MCGLRGLLVCACGTALFGISTNAFAGVINTTPIALSGQPAPGSPYHFDGPFANYIGDAGFVGASLALDNANPQDVGMWMGASSPPTYLARPHVQAPALPAGVNFAQVNFYPQVSGSNVLFKTSLEGTGVDSTNNSAAYVANANSSPQLLYRTGDPAPQISGATIQYGYLGGLNRSGSVGWTAFLAGAGITPSVNDCAMYVGTAGNSQVAVRGGASAPGLPGVNFQYAYNYGINDSGKILFDGTLTGSGVTASNSDSLWTGSVASPSMIARAGDLAPGTPVGGTFTSMQSAYLNNADRVVFSAGYSNAPDADNTPGLWSATAGSQPVPIMIPDQPAPGVSGDHFSYLESYKQSDNNKVALEAVATNSDASNTDEGLWFGDENGMQLIADQNGSTSQLSLDNWDINANGVLVWMQTNGGPPESASVWVRTPDGSERRLLGPGDQIDVGNGDLRTIAQVAFGASQTPLLTNQDSLGSDGSLVFTAIFTDGSNGVFVTSAVPEPSSIGIVAVILIAARRKPKRSPAHAIATFGLS